jgi:hypothetical protein
MQKLLLFVCLTHIFFASCTICAQIYIISQVWLNKIIAHGGHLWMTCSRVLLSLIFLLSYIHNTKGRKLWKFINLYLCACSKSSFIETNACEGEVFTWRALTRKRNGSYDDDNNNDKKNCMAETHYVDGVMRIP